MLPNDCVTYLACLDCRLSCTLPLFAGLIEHSGSAVSVLLQLSYLSPFSNVENEKSFKRKKCEAGSNERGRKDATRAFFLLPP